MRCASRRTLSISRAARPPNSPRRSGRSTRSPRSAKQLDTLASTYADLIRRRDEAEAAYGAAAKALGERRSRAEAIRRLLSRLPHLAALAEAERAASAARRPADAAGRLGRRGRPPSGRGDSADDPEGERRGCDQGASKRSSSGSATTRPPLAVAARVEGWDELRSRYVAAKDIPVRRSDLAARRAVVADILRRLGREGEGEPATLILPARTVGAIEDLIASRSGVESKLAAARESLEAARSALAEAVDAAPQTDVDAAAVERLKNRLQAVRRDNSLPRLRSAREEAVKTKRKLAEALAALKPWTGGRGDAGGGGRPRSCRDGGDTGSPGGLRARRQTPADGAAQKAAEAGRLKAEAAAAARAADLVGDDAALALRAARDDAWTAHRAALTLPTADAFETAMRADDAAGAARLAGARELAAQRERAVILAGVEADRARAEADLEAAEREIVATRA